MSWSGKRHCAALAVFVTAAAAAVGAALAAPATGRHAARLCVTTGVSAPGCGAAELDWRSGGRARLRISDIVYTLHFRTRQVDVVLKHGAMQIDAFTAIYEWQGETLSFVDADKNVRY